MANTQSPTGIAGKRCAHCNTHTTPLWRNGPDGPKTLCNACGVRDNRRQNKTRNVLQKPRVKKEPRPEKAEKEIKKKGDGNRPKRGSADYKDGIENDTNTTPTKGNKKKVSQRELNARIQGFNKDPFAKTENIHVPQFGKAETAQYYASMNDGKAYKPPQGYHKSDGGVVAARFGPNTAAATYECDDQDLQWLESQRDAFVAENMKEKKKTNTTMMKKKDQKKQGEAEGGKQAEMKGKDGVTQEHVEKLFDVFEEASWCASSMVSSNSACDIVLGRCYSPSTEEDALHWTSDQPMHEAFLVSPPHYKRNDKRHSLPNKYDTWGVIMNGGENSNDATYDCVTLPQTPSTNDVTAGDGGLIGKKMKTATTTTTTTHAKSKLNKSVINSGSENSSECSDDEHLARLEKLSDINDSDVENVSGNGSSNDLVVKRVTRSLNNTNSKSLTKVHLEGRAASAKQSAAALKLRKARRAAEWVPSTVDVGAGELKTPIQQKTKKNNTNNNSTKYKNNITNSDKKINTNSNAFDAFGGGGGGGSLKFGLTKRVTRGSKSSLSSLAETEEVFDRALLEKKMNLTVKVSQKNTSARAFFSPGASIRPKPFVMKHDASMDKAFAELRKKYPHAPSCEVVLTVHHYWYQKRMVHNNGRPLLSRFYWTPSKELRERPELATEAERDRYLFCFDAAAVKRQKAEKEERKNALMNSGGALAQKRRRRRACFNPAASKRRRKAQAEMDFATTQPLTICFEPLEDVLEYGLEYVEADDERYVELMALAERSGTPKFNANKRASRSAAARANNEDSEKNTIVGSLMKKMFGWRGSTESDSLHRPETPKKRRTPRGGSARA